MAREFIMPNKILTGENSLQDSGDYISELGSKALVVTDDMMVSLGNLKILKDVLKRKNIEYFIYSEVNGEPTDVVINKGVQVYKQNKCDFLIAVGGGSPIDSAKAISMMAINKGKISDYMGKVVTNQLPPIVAIPTTAGTGSEATQFTIISDTETNVKMLIKGSSLMPKLAIIDPKFTITVPAKVTAATGLDALTHAVEAYTSKKAQPLSDSLALSAVKRIFNNLKIAYNEPGNVGARNEMAIAALEAGIAFNNSSVTIVHGMSRPIGALFHVAHGLSNAMLLDKCFNYVVDGAYDKFARLGEAIGLGNTSMNKEEIAKSFVNAVSNLCKELDTPTLKEYGIDKEEFFRNIEKMSNDAMESGSPSNTMKKISCDDLIKIYISLWG